MSIIKNVFNKYVLPFIIPTHCPCCGIALLDETRGVCESCHQELEMTASCATKQKTCKVCFANISSQSPKHCWRNLGICQGRHLFFDRHISLYKHTKKWSKLLQDWKFRGNRSLYHAFLPQLSQQAQRLRRYEIERIGYISSRASSKDTRSYQPCYDLAAFLASAWKIGFGADIYKQKKHQQSGKSYPERFFAIHNAFAIAKSFPAPVPKNYLLVEDIYTTGATANEAARILKKKGVRKVFLLSMLKVARA